MAGSGTKSTTGALLGILSMSPKSGYELRTFMAESTGNFWSESFGQIYPTLKKLEAEGLLEVVENDSEGEGHPAKKRYRTSEKGVERLEEWLTEAPKPQVPRSEFLLKLFFGDRANRGEMAGHVEQKRAKAEADLQRYEPMMTALEEQFGKKPGQYAHPGLAYWLMTLKYGIAEATMAIEWCDVTLKELKKLDEAKKKEERV